MYFLTVVIPKLTLAIAFIWVTGWFKTWIYGEIGYAFGVTP